MKRWQDDELLDIFEDHNLKVGILITVDKDEVLSMSVRRREYLESKSSDALIGLIFDVLFRSKTTVNKLPI
jgi:hypothetical protein